MSISTENVRKLKLIIKTPSQKIEDQIVACDSNSDVRSLKSLLQEKYPTKPNPADLKLIYGGRFLKDDDVLSTVFETAERANDDLSFTLHLITKPSAQQSGTNGNNNNSSSSQNRGSTADHPLSDQQYRSFSETLRSFLTAGNHSYNLGSGNLASTSAGVPTFDAVSSTSINPQMLQQIHIMQNAYIQYMAHYFNSQQPNSGQQTTMDNSSPFLANAAVLPVQYTLLPVPPGAFPATLNLPIGIPQIYLNSTHPNFVNVAAPTPAAAAAVNVAANNQNGRQGQGNRNENDMFDYLYKIIRVLIFLMMFYIYSSITRLMLTFGMFFIIWVFKRALGHGYNQQHRNAEAADQQAHQQQPRQPAAENPPPAPNADNAQAGQNSDDELRRRTNISTDVDTEGQQRQQGQAADGDSFASQNTPPNSTNNQEEPMSKLRFIWLTVYSLVTSLMPEHPAPINLN